MKNNISLNSITSADYSFKVITVNYNNVLNTAVTNNKLDNSLTSSLYVIQKIL